MPCHKRYLAEVSGAFPDSVTTIEKPIGRDRHDARRMRVCRPGQGAARAHAGARARTAWQPHAPSRRAGKPDGTTRFACTSRLWAFPLWGDALYGGRRDPRGLMLHALEEEFDHPVTGAHVLLRTEVPGAVPSVAS
jgi:23S rRNA pseudouridine1911/1915/1917 synthase